MPRLQKSTYSEDASVPKRLQTYIAETDCDVVHSPAVKNKQHIFEPLVSTDVVDQFAHFPMLRLKAF